MHRPTSTGFLLGVAGIVAIAACGGKGGGGGGSMKEVEAKVDAVNAKVPANLKAHATFKAMKAEEGALGVLVPAGWTESKVIPGNFEPPDGSDLGFMTRYKVGSNCDGECTSKDWVPVVNKVEFESMTIGEVVTDEKLGEGGRLVVRKSSDRAEVRLALWKKGGSRYFTCGASLEANAGALTDAVVEACRSMVVLSWK